MRAYFSFIIGAFLFLFAGCSKDVDEFPVAPPAEKPSGEATTELPDGYFEVTFATGDAASRAAISGPDSRVSRLRYLIYDSQGNFVKERAVITASGSSTWPLPAVKDTLRKGSYTAVFLANVDNSLFPFTPMTGSTQVPTEVLVNYTGNMANARIVLPQAQFSGTTEYYWSKVTFSDSSAAPTILLQRIISLLNVHRNFVDAQTALNALIHNIQVNVTNAQVLTGVTNGLSTALGPLLGGLLSGLLTPVTDALNPLLVATLNNLVLTQLVNQVGMALTGNTNQAGLLANLGVLLNPWADNEAKTTIVTLRNFPKAMDFNLAVTERFAGDNRFRFDFTPGTDYAQKDVPIRGFHGLFDVIKVNVIKEGLVSGLVIDRVIDNQYLLNGTFVDINDELQATVATNLRYKADYSFVDLGLKSYTSSSTSAFSVSVRVGDIANIDNILNGVLGSIGSALLGPIKNITITVPIHLPLLGVENLSLSGGWSAVNPY